LCRVTKVRPKTTVSNTPKNNNNNSPDLESSTTPALHPPKGKLANPKHIQENKKLVNYYFTTGIHLINYQIRMSSCVIVFPATQLHPILQN
jgi:hypothetical protein